MKFKFKHADKIVGLFILLAIVFLAAVLIFIGINKRWFAKDIGYTTQFNSATRLKKNMPIVLSGVKIGHVDDYTLVDVNEVSVTITIYEEYIEYARPNSVLKMGGNALGLGAGVIYFFPGKTEGKIAEGSLIPSTDMEEGRNLIKAKLVIITQQEDDIDEILKNIKYGTEGLEEAISSINQAVQDIDTMILSITAATEGTGEGSLNDILVNLELLSESLSDIEGLIPKLVASEGSTVDTLFNDNNDLYNEIYSIFGGLDDTMSNLIDLTGNLNGMTPQMNLVLEQLNGTLKDTQKVLEGLRNNPLLRGGISQEVEPEVSETELREEEF